ncbi:MAG: hypothetical protein WBA41_22500 [Rivularia sp. (in: cyanobacteria)]
MPREWEDGEMRGWGDGEGERGEMGRWGDGETRGEGVEGGEESRGGRGY